jgi:hypothetical protein
MKLSERHHKCKIVLSERCYEDVNWIKWQKLGSNVTDEYSASVSKWNLINFHSPLGGNGRRKTVNKLNGVTLTGLSSRTPCSSRCFHIICFMQQMSATVGGAVKSSYIRAIIASEGIHFQLYSGVRFVTPVTLSDAN